MSCKESISFKIEDQIAYLGFGHSTRKSMAILDLETLERLEELLTKIENLDKKQLKGVILFTEQDRSFLAGADLDLIASLKTEAEAVEGSQRGQKLFNRLEDLPFPTIACIHGMCLGGGLELAMACDTLLASKNKETLLGLPEVKLGLLPGFGGTYRLPRRVGLAASLELILTGKMISSIKANKIRLVEGVYPREHLIPMAKKLFSMGVHRRKHHENFFLRKIIFSKARTNVLKKTKGMYHAPLRILDLMERGVGQGRASYLSHEARVFGELCLGLQSSNLRHVFSLSEKTKKYPRESSSTSLKPLLRGGVLGAGTMGGGIAWLMANARMHPILKDINLAPLEVGLNQSSHNFRGALKRKKITTAQMHRKQFSIRPSLNYDGFSSLDLVIEAVVEDMNVKQKVLIETEKKINENCILATNSSSLSITEMAKVLERPQSFLGLHFFNPVHLMPLLEIVVHDEVDPLVLERTYQWGLRVKKVPVIVKDGPGFLVNRVLMPYVNEAGFLLEEGVAPKDLDEACLRFGMPMGPCRLLDEVGIDVAVKVAHILEKGLGKKAKASTLPQTLVEAGFLGRKNNKGFYSYDSKGKETEINPKIAPFLPSKRVTKSEKEIVDRVILPMINGAAACLEEGIVKQAGDIDLSVIFGIGFPPFRGGLLRYADTEGVRKFVSNGMKKFKETVNEDRYKPCLLLEELANSDGRFYPL